MHSYPSPDCLRYKAAVGERLFPIPEILLPRPPCSKSSRLRAHYQSKLAVWALASSSLASLNRLYAGNNCHGARRRTGSEVSSDVSAAWTQLHRHLLTDSALQHRTRWESSLTDAAALRELLKAKSFSYSRLVAPSVAQVPLRADCIDEPAGDNAVDLLDAFDYLESNFYNSEEKIWNPRGSQLSSSRESKNIIGSSEVKRISTSSIFTAPIYRRTTGPSN